MAESKKQKSVLWQSISIAMQLGYVIAIPLVVLAIGGRILDKHYNSSPIFLLTGVVLSLIVSSILAFIKIKNILQEINSHEHKNTRTLKQK